MAIGQVDLSGHVALVTGGRQGIGRAIARRLSAAGARIVIAAKHRSDERVEETLAAFKAAGVTVGFLDFDLNDAAARGEAIAKAGAFFGPVDILVNNAAVGGIGTKPSDISLETRREIFEVNVQGPIDLIQQALPSMRQKGWGRILNLLSETMREPAIPYSTSPAVVQSLVVYGASKIALERYTLGLAAELFGTGIHVNAIYPHSVCVTENNSPRALAGLKANPSAAESVEMMAEAAYLMIAGDVTGLSMSSRKTLQFHQQPLHALDGKTVIGDAMTVPVL